MGKLITFSRKRAPSKMANVTHRFRAQSQHYSSKTLADKGGVRGYLGGPGKAENNYENRTQTIDSSFLTDGASYMGMERLIDLPPVANTPDLPPITGGHPHQGIAQVPDWLPTVIVPKTFYLGQAWDHFGIIGDPSVEQVERLTEGLHPISGQKIAHAGKSRQMIALHEIVFSLPKELSLRFDHPEVMIAAEVALRAAVVRLEQLARIGNWKSGIPAKGLAVQAAIHPSGRANQPHVHAHVDIFSVAELVEPRIHFIGRKSTNNPTSERPTKTETHGRIDFQSMFSNSLRSLEIEMLFANTVLDHIRTHAPGLLVEPNIPSLPVVKYPSPGRIKLGMGNIKVLAVDGREITPLQVKVASPGRNRVLEHLKVHPKMLWTKIESDRARKWRLSKDERDLLPYPMPGRRKFNEQVASLPELGLPFNLRESYPWQPRNPLPRVAAAPSVGSVELTGLRPRTPPAGRFSLPLPKSGQFRPPTPGRSGWRPTTWLDARINPRSLGLESRNPESPRLPRPGAGIHMALPNIQPQFVRAADYRDPGVHALPGSPPEKSHGLGLGASLSSQPGGGHGGGYPVDLQTVRVGIPAPGTWRSTHGDGLAWLTPGKLTQKVAEIPVPLRVYVEAEARALGIGKSLGKVDSWLCDHPISIARLATELHRKVDPKFSFERGRGLAALWHLSAGACLSPHQYVQARDQGVPEIPQPTLAGWPRIQDEIIVPLLDRIAEIKAADLPSVGRLGMGPKIEVPTPADTPAVALLPKIGPEDALAGLHFESQLGDKADELPPVAALPLPGSPSLLKIVGPKPPAPALPPVAGQGRGPVEDLPPAAATPSAAPLPKIGPEDALAGLHFESQLGDKADELPPVAALPLPGSPSLLKIVGPKPPAPALPPVAGQGRGPVEDLPPAAATPSAAPLPKIGPEDALAGLHFESQLGDKADELPPVAALPLPGSPSLPKTADPKPPTPALPPIGGLGREQEDLPPIAATPAVASLPNIGSQDALAGLRFGSQLEEELDELPPVAGLPMPGAPSLPKIAEPKLPTPALPPVGGQGREQEDLPPIAATPAVASLPNIGSQDALAGLHFVPQSGNEIDELPPVAALPLPGSPSLPKITEPKPPAPALPPVGGQGGALGEDLPPAAATPAAAPLPKISSRDALAGLHFGPQFENEIGELPPVSEPPKVAALPPIAAPWFNNRNSNLEEPAELPTTGTIPLPKVSKLPGVGKSMTQSEDREPPAELPLPGKLRIDPRTGRPRR